METRIIKVREMGMDVCVFTDFHVDVGEKHVHSLKLTLTFENGDGFKYFCMFTPIWGNDPIWRAYFSNGLVQPPTSRP